MTTPAVQIKPLHPELGRSIPLPQRMSEHAAGFDLAAAIDGPIVLAPGERALVPCGFAMAVPPGYEAQVRPRSGLALKSGIGLLNSPGTIDADYRGEVKVLLINLGGQSCTIQPGERVAQLVFSPVVVPPLRTVPELSATPRGDNGFGSTGR